MNKLREKGHKKILAEKKTLYGKETNHHIKFFQNSHIVIHIHPRHMQFFQPFYTRQS